MGRLYLVRRNLESYLGPMSVHELQDGYRRMEFGLQDEVCGNCGAWVAFDDIDAVKKNYPDLADVVRETMLGGWGMSEHSGTRLLRGTKAKPKVKLGIRGALIRTGIFFSVMSLTVLAVVLAHTSDLSSKFFRDAGAPSESHARAMIAAGDFTGFSAYMDKNLPIILPKVTSSRQAYNDWIPLLRRYAFAKDGKVDGLKAKLLRGMGSAAAPAECSLEIWRARWMEEASTWRAMLEGQELPKRWSRIVTWDSHWLARRRRAEGWEDPGSYFQACIVMAKKGLEGVRDQLPADQKDLAKQLLNRLQFMAAIANGETWTDQVPKDNSLAVLTCIERATSPNEIQNCAIGQNYHESWRQYLDRRIRLAEFSLLTSGIHSIADDARLERISSLVSNLSPIDETTRFDYSAELKFARLLLLNSGQMEAAQTRLQSEFPEVTIR